MKADMDAQGNMVIIAETGVEGYALKKWHEAITTDKTGWESLSIVLPEVVKEDGK